MRHIFLLSTTLSLITLGTHGVLGFWGILDIAKKKEDQLQATINAINGIAENMDPDLMKKMARCNYEAMTKTL